MERIPFVLKRKDASDDALLSAWDKALPMLKASGVENFSVWAIGDFLFCYGEYPDGFCFDCLKEFLPQGAELFAAPKTLPLMYHNIGVVREDKSLIRHRVFATKLKSGCEEEYKRRHDVLVDARGDEVAEGPESNFTIWLANGYIFGYCELVRAFDHEPTEEEKAATIAWETRQLEIMDWLTDDVDWITGQHHDPVRLVCKM